MPNIPSIAGGNPLPKLPGPTLDRERRPTVNNRNVQAATEQLGRSTRTPELPMSLAENGLENIGQGVARVGNVVTAAAIQEQEATTRVQIHRADNALQTKLAEFDAWRADNPDPLTWQEKWSTMVSPMREQLLADKGLTGRAREEIALRSETFLARNTAEVTRVSRVAINGEAKKAILGNLRNAVASQDITAFEGYLAEGAKYLPDYEQKAIRLEFKEEGERLKLKVEGETFKNVQNNAITFTQAHGAEVAINNVKGGAWGDIDATQQEQVIRSIRSVENAAKAQVADTIANGIASGKYQSKADFMAEIGKSPFLSPQLIEEAEKSIYLRDEFAEKLDRDEHGVRNAVELRKRIASYEPSKDPDRLEYFTLAKEINTRADQSQAGELGTDLARKYGTTPPKAATRPELQQNISKKLDSFFPARSGPMQYEWPVKDKGGKISWVKNEENFRANLDAQTRLEMKMGDFLKLKPDASVKEADDYLLSILPEGTRPAALKMMQQAMKQPATSAATGGLDDDLIATVKDFESFIPNAYGDYKQLSVGYGTRAKSPDEKLTEPQAEARLREELSMHAGRIDKAAAETGVALSKSQRNALISFDFNTGQGAYLIESSRGNLKEIKRRLVLYTKAGGKELPGLVTRRQREAGMFDL